MSVKITLINKQADIDPVYSSQIASVVTLTPEVILSSPWSPVVYKSGETRRNSANFAYIQILALDIDNDPGSPYFSIQDASRQFSGYKHIIATTASHQKPKGTKPAVDRFRVILYFETPINDANTYKNNWLYWVKLLGLEGIADPATKDAARFYKSSKSIVSSSDSGIILSVVETEQPKVRVQNTTETVAKGKLSKDTMAFIAGLSGQDNWHASFIKAALNMKAQGYTEKDAETMLTKASPVLKLDGTDLAQLADVYKNRTPYEQPKIDWPVMLPPNQKSPARPHPKHSDNKKYLIKNIMNFDLYYDKRRDLILTNLEEDATLSSMDFSRISATCDDYGLDITNLKAHIFSAANAQTVDPLKNVFESVVWDGKDHLGELFTTLKIPATSNEREIYWYREFFVRWMRAMAMKYIRPGSQNCVLVFVGRQGLGKSRWLQKMASPWPAGFKDSQIDPANKDHSISQMEKFLWHISELETTTGSKDVGALKDFLTKEDISERRPYAMQTTNGKSICSFCASVNSTDFLHDSSGNRRFYIIPLEGLNADHNVDIYQAYAQAFAEAKAGKDWYFTSAEIAEYDKLTDFYRSKDAIEERLDACLEPGEDRLSIPEIIRLATTLQDSQTAADNRQFRNKVSGMLLRKGIQIKNINGRKLYCINANKIREDINPSPKNVKMEVLDFRRGVQ